MEQCPQCNIDLNSELACIKCGRQMPQRENDHRAPESASNQPSPEAQAAGTNEGARNQVKLPIARNLESPPEAQAQLLAAESAEQPKVKEPAPKHSPPPAVGAGDAPPRPVPQQPGASPNQPPPEKKDANDKRPAAPPVAGGEINVKESEVEQIVKIEGDFGNAAQTLIQYYFGQSPLKEQSKKEDQRSIVDVTTTLSSSIPPFVSDDLQRYLDQLKQDRLLLVSCPDGQMALTAANAIVERLQLPEDEQKRLLNFDRAEEESVNLNIYFFLRKEAVTETQTAIIVDAISEKASGFLNSLISAAPSLSMSLADDLRRNELLMLCLVDAPYVENLLAESKRELKLDKELMFTHWKVPFLRPLLKQSFPLEYEELENKILRQREQLETWSRDDKEFCDEIKSALKARRLPEELQQREAPPEPIQASSIFKGNDPLQDTVAYVGAFFQDLSPPDFIRVVTLLLGNRMKIALVPAEKKNEEGKTVQVEIQKEIPLAEVWQQSHDSLLDQCHLVTIIKDSTRAVVFDNHRLREHVKEHLERKHAFYLEGQFQCVQKLGLLFDPSARIAENVMRIVIAMAAFSAEDFLIDWLLEIVTELETTLGAGNKLSRITDNSVFQAVKETDPARARGKIYLRISELLRKILEEEQLKEQLQGVVDNFIQRLMSAKLHASVLEIVRRIKFAPGFDQLKWLRQLLDQGDEDRREQTYEYLYFSVKEMGVRGFRVIESLESWLPKEDRSAQSYSFSNRHALRLLLDLSSETLGNFDPQNYGVWPTTYSLLNFKDAETATQYLKLLSKWLFHPGMKHAFGDFGIEVDINRLNSALIAEWTFILRAPRATAASSAKHSTARPTHIVTSGAEKQSTPASEIDALTVRNILLQQVIEASDRSQQIEMLAYWDDLKEQMLRLANLFSAFPTSKQYKATVWKRQLVKNLISDFRALQKQTNSIRQQTISV